ncbi:MAG: NAD(P)/FAD-dependent oxidoreductase [Actinomycetota bacterium]
MSADTARPAPMKSLGDDGPIVVLGAGPVGSLLALYLARRGHHVRLFESRPDLRRTDIAAGRSINLALATRGIVPLQDLGLFETVEPILVPMAGRMVHQPGEEPTLQPYGLGADDVIHSVSRTDLNAILLDAAEATGNVEIRFDLRCRSVDVGAKALTFTDAGADDAIVTVDYGTLFGCDGANSAVAEALRNQSGGHHRNEPLDHGYKELTIPPAQDGGFRIDPNALHIWPRGEFMVIALANPDGDFTVTLFLPMKGSEHSFEALTTTEAVEAFFSREFPEIVELIPNLADDFFDGPTGELATIGTENWHLGDEVLLVGDAAYAIVPFHGQGMNQGMESVRVLDRYLGEYPDDLGVGFARFAMDRIPDAKAIAQMAIDNYVEMRAGVVDPQYLLKRELALELERRFPDKIAARYGMVMFTTMRYAEVIKRHHRQQALIDELVGGATSVDEVDLDRAAALVDRLAPLPAWT